MSNPSSDSYRNPLRHMGQDYSFVPRYLRNRDPLAPTNASRDIKPKENQGYYPFGSIWNNSTNGNVWILAGIVNNLANWVLIGSSHGNILTLSDNANTIVNPSLSTGNIQLTGQLNEQSGSFSTVVADAPNNLIILNPMSSARWIVDPLGASVTDRANGTHTTIASAIASATSGDTIFIMPGTYTENFTWPAGINLTAFEGDYKTPNVTIIGKITCTTAGERTISGIRLQTNSDFFLAVTGSAATIVRMVNCYLNCTNNTGISFTSSNAGSAIECITCDGNIALAGIAYFAHSSSGTLQLRFGVFANTGSSTTSSTGSAGQLILEYMRFLAPITTSGTCLLNVFASNVSGDAINTTAVTCGGSTLSSCIKSNFFGGTASAVSISTSLRMDDCGINSSNTNAVAGAGTLIYGLITFDNTSNTIGTAIQSPQVSSNDAIKVITPAAYPYTTIPQDGLIKVDTSIARTINPLANPQTGQRHIIKDTVGNAAGANITITPTGKNIDGAASLVINTNYGTATIVYTGTEWSSV